MYKFMSFAERKTREDSKKLICVKSDRNEMAEMCAKIMENEKEYINIYFDEFSLTLQPRFCLCSRS